MNVRAWIGVLGGGWGRLDRLVELQQVVASHLPLLPVVGAQLRDTSRQVERAVAQVGGNFERMVECARAGVNQASQLIGEGGAGEGSACGVQAMLTASRKTLESLLVDNSARRPGVQHAGRAHGFDRARYAEDRAYAGGCGPHFIWQYNSGLERQD